MRGNCTPHSPSFGGLHLAKSTMPALLLTIHPRALFAGIMAAAGIGGGRDEAMAEKCFVFAADEANSASAAVLYRLAQLHLTAFEAEEPVDVSAPLPSFLGSSSRSWLSFSFPAL